MMLATGSCAGIENYSRYLTGRRPASRRRPCSNTCPTTRSSSSTKATSPCRRSAPCITATSSANSRSSNTASACQVLHRQPPAQIRGMGRDAPADHPRLATPGPWELERTGGVFTEQVIRPTGLIDPPVEIRPVQGQQPGRRPHRRGEGGGKKGFRCSSPRSPRRWPTADRIHARARRRVRYLHSDIDTLERIEIIRDLRLGAFDVLVGINLLREGLDIPECASWHSGRRQGGLPALRDLADPDHRPRGAQCRRQGHALCR
jgi:excinuclease ABC subunit B